MQSSIKTMSGPVALALALLPAACSDSEGTTANAAAPQAAVIADQPLPDFQVALLEQAMRAASAPPLYPHVKNRSRFQERVVLACLELDQPQRALDYTERIENWRRGAGYADYAFYCVRNGHTDVQKFLDLAHEVAESGTEDEELQGWRRDRIRVKIARTHALLGQAEEAARFEEGVVESEAGKVVVVRAMLADEEGFDAQLETLEAVIVGDSLDQVRNALEACAQLYERFYADPDRRARVEAQIEGIRGKVPAQVYVDIHLQLAGSAVEHGDPQQALRLVNEAQSVFDGLEWLPKDHVALSGRLAAQRYRAGEERQARTQAHAALELYDAERERIVDIWRAGALRPLAEAYHTMEDRETALALYKRALDECTSNPNSRPRAEDLVAICLSLARNGIEPDAQLRARLQQVHDGLGDPW